MITQFKKVLLPTSAALGALCSMSPASAATRPQDGTAAGQAAPPASQAGEAPAEPDRANEVIVVTAQRRSENLQNVPISISALTERQLELSGIRNTTELGQAIPGLNFTQTGMWATPFIRGVGTDSYAPGSDPSVPTYIDGVYIANNSAPMTGFNNVERIEVLRGPQGTLYGRNSSGGLVSIITRTPTQDFQARATAGFGNFNVWELGGYISGGIAPEIAADFAVNFRDQGRGFFRNIANGGRIGRREGLYLRSRVVIDPSNAIRLILSGDYADFDNTVGTPRQPRPGGNPILAPGAQISTVPGVYAFNPIEQGSVRDYGGSAHLSVDLGGARIVSITAYRESLAFQSSDSDDATLNISSNNVRTPYHQFTQEVQILSPENSRFNWIIGAFYLSSDGGFDPIILRGLNGVPTLTASLFSATQSIAGFAQASFNITQNGQLTLGARYTYDEKDFRRSSAPGGDVSSHWTRPTWRIAYDHRLSEDVLLYASYNRGYKSGSYNTILGPPIPVNPETVDAFEVGAKMDLLDNRLRVNVATFYSLFNDIQIRSVNPNNGSILLQNATSAEIYGLDGDVQAVLSSDLRLQVTFSWIHGRYTDFPGAVTFIPNPNGQPGNVQVVRDASGNPLIRTPELSGSVSLNYNHRYADRSRLYASGRLFISDETSWDPSNRVVTPGYAVVNATIGYTLPGGQYSVEVWSENLTDKSYVIYGSANGSPTDRFSYSPPRTYGVRLRAEF